MPRPGWAYSQNGAGPMVENETEYLLETLLGDRVNIIESLNQAETKCWPVPKEENYSFWVLGPEGFV